VLSAGQFVVIQLPDGDAPSSVTAQRGDQFSAVAASREGFIVIPPLTPGPLVLTYEVSGDSKDITVDVP